MRFSTALLLRAITVLVNYEDAETPNSDYTAIYSGILNCLALGASNTVLYRLETLVTRGEVYAPEPEAPAPEPEPEDPE